MTETTLLQVGRQCLQSFTGIANPEQICSMAEILCSVSDLLSSAEDDNGFGGGGRQPLTSIDFYLPYVACSIREIGWLSRGEALKSNRQGSATADDAMWRGVFADKECKNPLRPTEKDYNLASAVTEFIQDYFEGCDVSAISDYENSLRVAMASGVVHPKFMGIIASAIQFYNKDLERRARTESWSKLVAGSRFQGEINERRVFENLKVLSYRTWDSNWGVTHFYSFLSEAGLITYFATHDMGLSIGQTISLKATVKKHEVYQPKTGGAPVNQTVITRATLVARATLKAVDTIQVPGDLVVANQEALDKREALYAEYARPFITLNAYHFEAVNGQKFIFTSKSKKKALVPGVEALVEYTADGCFHEAERYVSLVK